jgi:predicted oxidoreductase
MSALPGYFRHQPVPLGIVVDRNGAVLDRNDTPVPGLFAAGSTVGGLDGGPNAGYVGGLIKTTIALRAAEAIAAA